MPLNLNEFYKTGFASSVMHKKHISRLIGYIAQEHWSKCDEAGVLIPEWMSQGFNTDIGSDISVFLITMKLIPKNYD